MGSGAHVVIGGDGLEWIGMVWNGLAAVLTAGGGGCGRQRDPN